MKHFITGLLLALIVLLVGVSPTNVITKEVQRRPWFLRVNKAFIKRFELNGIFSIRCTTSFLKAMMKFA